MADIKQLTVNGVTYNIRDEEARRLIEALQTTTAFLGVSDTELVDGSTAGTISIDGTMVECKNGNIAVYGTKEFIFNGERWFEFGDLSVLGALAYKSQAQASYTPQGSVSQPTTTAETASATVNSIVTVGRLPSFTVTDGVLNIDPGELPTKGDNQTVITAIKSIVTSKPTFTGTTDTITVQ